MQRRKGIALRRTTDPRKLPSSIEFLIEKITCILTETRGQLPCRTCVEPISMKCQQWQILMLTLRINIMIVFIRVK